jgi:hypothetical protein
VSETTLNFEYHRDAKYGLWIEVFSPGTGETQWAFSRSAMIWLKTKSHFATFVLS